MAAITEESLLDEILAQLQTELAVDPSRCYAVESPEAQRPEWELLGGGAYVLQVSIGEMQFMQDEQGIDESDEDNPVSVLPVKTAVEVTIYSRIQLDEAGRATEMLKQATRGMLPLRRKVLRALIGFDTADEDLASTLHGSHVSRIEYSTQNLAAWQTVYFDAEFDLDIGTEPDPDDETDLDGG